MKFLHFLVLNTSILKLFSSGCAGVFRPAQEAVTGHVPAHIPPQQHGCLHLGLPQVSQRYVTYPPTSLKLIRATPMK